MDQHRGTYKAYDSAPGLGAKWICRHTIVSLANSRHETVNLEFPDPEQQLTGTCGMEYSR